MIEPSRRVALLPLALLLPFALLAGCSTPRDAVARLGELYARHDDVVAEYSAEIDDPVDEALEQLACLEEGDEEDLEPGERVAAVATLAELSRLDRSRIVRARALGVLLRQLDWLPADRRPATLAPIDEAELTRALEPLLALAECPPEEVAARVGVDGPALLAAARALAAAQPDSFALTLRLTRLAAKSARRARDGGGGAELLAALDGAGAAQARQLAFVVARADARFGRGVLDPAGEVRAAAGALLCAIDPIAATVELGRAPGPGLAPAWNPGVPSLVRIAWLQQLERAHLTGANVHPALRSVLVQELQSDDAAIAFAARGAVAHLLGRARAGDAAAAAPAALPSVAELKSAWLALGEWQATPAAGDGS